MKALCAQLGAVVLVIGKETEFVPEYLTNLLGGIAVLTATATGLFKSPGNAVEERQVKVMAVPYYANANRGTCPMQVWMAEDKEVAEPQGQE